MKIDDRAVGQGHRPYIVAEAGVNHKGSIEVAKRLCWEAAGAGADAIKFQSYKAERLVTEEAPTYWDTGRESVVTQYEVFQEADSFDEKEYALLFDECEKAGITFLTTAFDEEFVSLFDQMGMAAFKVASADLTNAPLLQSIGATGKPVILSTGASRMEEVVSAVNVLRASGSREIGLLHCVLSYPTAYRDANLKSIDALADEFPDCAIGLSDHTLPDRNLSVLMAAVARGAMIIEKHFTLNRSWPGDDHYHSLEPEELAQLVDASQRVREALGEKEVMVQKCELEARNLARRSLVTRKALEAGAVISRDDLVAKRPGQGISPSDIDEVVGKTLTKPMEKDELLTWDVLSG